MADQLTIARNRLFGEGGPGVTNLKVSAGSSREVTAEQVAREVNRSLSQLEAGLGEPVDPAKE